MATVLLVILVLFCGIGIGLFIAIAQQNRKDRLAREQSVRKALMMAEHPTRLTNDGLSDDFKKGPPGQTGLF